ncbi:MULTISPECIES: coiled-coil domain-containing protein [Gammaproteobacteria]|uniref:hypothetical protein n=1 Tax=Gammaproteobacteria TaxID=1236 RepID=UPI001237F268|nr:hypothetical protein [Candidatus Enterovibrio escacola]
MSKHLLWIGAGEAQQFDFDYTKYTKVIFVDPLLHIAAEEQIKDKEKFVTVQKAVTTRAVNTQLFKLFNNEEFSSFLEPGVLKEVYPNLHVEEILNVETIGIIDLIKEQRITGNENTLVLDLPCLSLDILNELKSKEILTLFQEIYVCAGKKSLFINGGDIKTITETLNNAFYEFVSKSNSDIDICTHQFEFNPLLERVHVQKTEILDLQAQIKLVVDTHQELENEKEELKVLLTNSQLAFSEVQSELSATNEKIKHLQDKVEDYSKQVNDLNLNKESLESQLLISEEKLTAQTADTKQLQSKLQAQQKRTQYLQEETEKLQASKKTTSHKIEALESDLQTANNTVVDYAKQMTDLNLNIEILETELRTAEGDLAGRIKAAEQLESELKIQQEREKQLQGKINELQASEKEKLDKIEVLEADLKTANKTVKFYSEQINNLNQNEESLEVQLSTAKSELAALETKLSSVSDNATLEIDTLTKDNEKLTFALTEEKARADKAHASEQSLKATLSEQESRNKQTNQAYENELQELKTKLKESEEKQKETYGWFASRKQQAEALTEELEVLKRENALLASNNETALAVSELESKLTAMLNKQNEDSIEIANALGKHVTRCHEEQKSNIASQFELRKLTGFSRIPISTNSYDMDSANLAELSSLVSQNTYDVIIEFGCGLSTIVSASTLQDKADRGFNNGKYLEDKGNNSEIEKALPKHIVGFEQSSERLKETTGLLSNAGVEAYVDLCHAPLVSVAHTDSAKGGELFYDCTEKLLELKRILNNRHANILVVINGPFLDDDTKAKYWALPLVLDYFSQADITVFTNGTNSEQISDLIPQWEDECERRQLTANVKKLKTPKGVTIITIQS